MKEKVFEELQIYILLLLGILLSGCGVSNEDANVAEVPKDTVVEQLSVNNPYFPAETAQAFEMNFKWDMAALGKTTMEFEMDEAGKKGILYHVSCHNPKEISDTELSKLDKEFQKEVEEEMDILFFWFWVTDTKIYYIPHFYTEDNVMDESAKRKLLFDNEIPECAVMVCQDEEMPDTLKEMEAGKHQWIEQHPGDIRCYRSYTSIGEGDDTSDILQFVWKKDIGLIGMRYAAHPAGGTYFWRDSYLQIDEMLFSIDAEQDD